MGRQGIFSTTEPARVHPATCFWQPGASRPVQLVKHALTSVMSSPNPRKRPASGAPPMVHPQLPPSFSAVQPEQLFRWNSGADGNGFADSGSPGVNSFAMLPTAGAYGQAIPAPSTALARRQNSRALVSSGSRPPFPGTDNWKGYSEDGNYLPAAAPAMDEHDNIERLEEMAQRAKRDAQAKRKQIPPFVQKLSRCADALSPLIACIALTEMQLLG